MGTTALHLSGGCSISNMSKLLIASLVLATVCAEADPGYVYGVPALHNAYPNWPGVSTPYSSSTCYGCRGYIGKRSADAEPGYLSYGLRPYAYGYGLRPYGLGVAGHPGAATSFVARSPQGLGKRSADAEPGYLGYGLRPYGYGFPYAHRAYGYGYGYGRGYYWG